jgi:hypothetical protein
VLKIPFRVFSSARRPSAPTPPSSFRIPAPAADLGPAARPRNGFIANVDTRHVPVYDLQPRIFRTQLSFQFPALLAVQQPACQTLESRFLAFRHVILSFSFEWTGSGSAGDHYTISPTGSGPAFFKDGTPPITETPLPKSSY